MLVLYNHPLSGNCHKVRLFLSILELSFTTQFVDVPNGDHDSQEFFDLNPLRQIPVLDDSGFVIQDSQAILAYLALKYAPAWLGNGPAGLGRVIEWLSFAAKEIAVTLQPARLHYLLGHQADIDALHDQGNQVLRVMEHRLDSRMWLTGDEPTVADIACFPYVALAHEGGFQLADYPAILRWIEHLTCLPGYVSMPGLSDTPHRFPAH